MNHDDIPYEAQLEEIRMVEEMTEMSMPSLSVHVDFNDLYADHEDKAFDLIGKLKDLLA